MVAVLLACLVAFLCGSIPFGYILVKKKTGKDIRDFGSGNIGSTNVARVLGGKWGYVVLFFDILKGVAGIGLAILILENGSSFSTPASLLEDTLTDLIPFFAVAGHCFSPWLGWKGGKGVATMFGITIAVLGWWFLVPLFVYLLVSKGFRAVSIGSLLASLSLPFIAAFSQGTQATIPSWGFAQDQLSLPMFLPITILVWWQHRKNIQRLVQGKERRIS
ncbi:glycerol-3-phosphate 1-O-acyltransferase PlsY [bacterium]|nr:glycerol-3-phosphate 1-O-acyltransferase PlsY [bacterium]